MRSTEELSERTATTLPPVFCWTKMGAEAGQPLNAIVKRKELERAAGGGSFCWGIGSSLGSAPRLARDSAPGNKLDVVFTPMKSQAKSIDSGAKTLLLWTTCELPGGSHVDLPEHMVLTSRELNPSGVPKKTHYALICISQEPLNEQDDLGAMDASCVTNFLSNNPVGASQVTAIVNYKKTQSPTQLDNPYEIAFRAQFYGLGFVRLVDPVPLRGELETLYRELIEASDANRWKTLSQQLRRNATKLHRAAASQASLFSDVLSV